MSKTLMYNLILWGTIAVALYIAYRYAQKKKFEVKIPQDIPGSFVERSTGPLGKKVWDFKLPS